jgi:hypothetical protein
MISKEALEKFKKIYKDEFGVDLADDVALEKAASLLTMMNAIYRPIKVEDYNRLQERRKKIGDPE